MVPGLIKRSLDVEYKSGLFLHVPEDMDTWSRRSFVREIIFFCHGFSFETFIGAFISLGLLW
jgi:hypothetical protein